MKKPNELGGRRCITRRGLVRAGLLGVGLGVCAGITNVFPVSASADDDPLHIEGVSFWLDNDASLFCGGNMKVIACNETEGVIVCCGDLTHDLLPANDINEPQQICARAAWGMGSGPTPYVDHLVVGGIMTVDDRSDVAVTGNTRIGGALSETDTGRLRVVTEAQVAAWGNSSLGIPIGRGWLFMDYHDGDWAHYADEATRRRYQNVQNTCSIRSNLGRRNALTATVTDDGDTFDYSTYVEAKLRPMSTRLAALEPTGQISFEKCGPIRNRKYLDYATSGDFWTVGSDVDVWLRLTGDGTSGLQVFEIAGSELDRQLTALGGKNFSIDVENVPADASIVVNVTGQCAFWHSGMLNRLNGQSCDTWVNASNKSEEFKRFAQLASMLLWNFPDTDSLYIDGAHGFWQRNNTGDVTDQTDVVLNGCLFPGSVLVPNGDCYIYGYTNGHIACSGDMTLEVWEHHNIPWRAEIDPGTSRVTKTPSHRSWI